MYNRTDIDDYQNRLSDEKIKKLLRHCNKHSIAPEICAWYDDMADFFEDWCGIGYTKTQARDVMRNNKDEFCKFANGEIVRLVK
jgi:hypothetical protein